MAFRRRVVFFTFEWSFSCRASMRTASPGGGVAATIGMPWGRASVSADLGIAGVGSLEIVGIMVGLHERPAAADTALPAREIVWANCWRCLPRSRFKSPMLVVLPIALMARVACRAVTAG